MKTKQSIEKIKKALSVMRAYWRKKPYLLMGLGLLAIGILTLLWLSGILQAIFAVIILFLLVQFTERKPHLFVSVQQRVQACLEALVLCKEELRLPCQCLEDWIPDTYTQWPESSWDWGVQGGLPFIYLFLPHTAPQALPAETLEQEKRILQQSIAGLLRSNRIAGLPIVSIDGQTPILFLWDIIDDGQTRRFAFAWLEKEEHIQQMNQQQQHRHQRPIIPKNLPDRDF